MRKSFDTVTDHGWHSLCMAAGLRHQGELPMNVGRVRALLREQFPQWADLPLTEVTERGTDHTLFRLGDTLVARMPIRPFDGSDLDHQQAGREARWLPFLAPQVPLQLPTPRALGLPTADYPWHWSVVDWIEGERVTRDNVDPVGAAKDLAAFIRALHSCDATGGPKAGPTTWLRGLPIKPWDAKVREWIGKADDDYDLGPAIEVWDDVLATPDWDGPPRWFHGDLAWNLIARDGRLTGVIDSPYGVGDPACDLVPGWVLFRGDARKVFFEECDVDDNTIRRSRGWALGPAFIGLTYYRTVPELRANAVACFEGVLSD